MKTNKLLRSINIVLLASGLALTSLVMAGLGHENGHHGHDKSQSGHMKPGSGYGHMMSEQSKDKLMREVIGEGRINKVMAEKHMINIKHVPIPEMKWPKMRMNFKAQKQVNLSELELGQEVNFTLLVGGENNYVIKEITVKK